MRTSPSWISSRLLRQRRSVDLPEPLGPMIQDTCPVWTSKSTFLNTVREPNRLTTPRAETAASLIRCRPLQRLLRLRGGHAARAASVDLFDRMLNDGKDRRHGQVPYGGDDQQRYGLII